MYENISIGVIGAGFVGKAVCRGLGLYGEMKTHDIVPELSSHTFEEVVNSDFVFVCLPTPMVDAEGGHADLSIIENFFSDVDKAPVTKRGRIFIIKSTVPVGTTRRLNGEHPALTILHNPEFLTARNALLDFLIPARNIVGGNNVLAVQKLAGFFRNRYPGVTCYCMSSNESEMVKYMANCYFATKVTFFNEMRLLVDKMGLQWDKVLEGVMADGRIAKSHYQVPGHDGDNGYGGTCFPKDINALIRTFLDNDLDPILLKASWEQNKKVRKNWDWATNPSAVSQKSESK